MRGSAHTPPPWPKRDRRYQIRCPRAAAPVAGPGPAARCGETPAHKNNLSLGQNAGTQDVAPGNVPALVPQIRRDGRVAVKALTGATDLFLARPAVIQSQTVAPSRPFHGEGINIAAGVPPVGSDRCLSPSQQPHRQFARRIPDQTCLAVQSLPQPDTPRGSSTAPVLA